MSRGEYARLPLHSVSVSDAEPHLRSPIPHDFPPAAHSLPRRRRPWYVAPVVLLGGRRPPSYLTLLKIVIPCVVLFVLGALYLWEPHIEISFYSRSWIKSEVEPVLPLSGCFDPARVSSRYNVSESLYGPKSTEVHAGFPMRLGMACYDFAGTVQPSVYTRRGSRLARTHYHTYWRTDLAPFGARQEWMLKSFFATQDTDTARLVLWSNGDLSENAILRDWLRRYPEAFELRVVDHHELARGTPLEGSGLLDVKDTKAWIDGDLVRLLVMWAYGGVWVDMDSLLTRDLAPLLEHEFVTQWDCYDKVYVPFNGALMNFHQHSPYLCEAFHLMVISPPPRQGTTDWGATLYLKLWRALTAASIPPFKVLPFCFTDGRTCRLDNRLPDPFVDDPADGRWTFGLGREEGGGLDLALKKVFSMHLHNQWQKPFPHDGWVERLLLKRYDERLSNVLVRTTGDIQS